MKVAFETLGCRSNQADTLELQAAIVDAGATPCSFDSEADVYVINTCTVTDEADRAAYKLIRKAREKSPLARIVVTGCGAESNQANIEALGVADAIIGPGQRSELVQTILSGNTKRITRNRTKGAKKRRVPFLAEALRAELSESLPGPGQGWAEGRARARFHLRVQEGCENSCTFCIIPQSRGGLVSRSVSQIIDDLKRLAELGYNEVVLTGTHLGGYGVDRNASLTELLAELAKQQFLPRIRLSSLDPNDVSPELIDILAESHAFCRHLHICVQAFSDSVLKRMNRRYLLSEVYDIIGHLQRRMPDCCLGSDLITGFPGESRQDVEQAIQVFLGLPFSYLHVFPYSERSGTAATRLDSSVVRAERKRRAARWRALSEQRWVSFLRGLVGKELEMIVEGGGDETTKFGTSREFASLRLELKNMDSTKNKIHIGQKLNVFGKHVDMVEGQLVCDF